MNLGELLEKTGALSLLSEYEETQEIKDSNLELAILNDKEIRKILNDLKTKNVLKRVEFEYSFQEFSANQKYRSRAFLDLYVDGELFSINADDFNDSTGEIADVTTKTLGYLNYIREKGEEEFISKYNFGKSLKQEKKELETMNITVDEKNFSLDRGIEQRIKTYNISGELKGDNVVIEVQRKVSYAYGSMAHLPLEISVTIK